MTAEPTPEAAAEPVPAPGGSSSRLDHNGRPMDTWRVAGTSIYEPYPDRRRRPRPTDD